MALDSVGYIDRWSDNRAEAFLRTEKAHIVVTHSPYIDSTFNLYNSTTITCFSLIYIIAAINLLICLWMSVCDFDLITHSLYLDGLFHVISILTMNSSFKP